MKQPTLFQPSPICKKAHEQAKHVQFIKDKRAKEQQIHMLCDTWKAALKGVK